MFFSLDMGASSSPIVTTLMVIRDYLKITWPLADEIYYPVRVQYLYEAAEPLGPHINP